MASCLQYVRSGKYTTASEMWSVGCVMMEMVTGHPPWPQLATLELLPLSYQVQTPVVVSHTCCFTIFHFLSFTITNYYRVRQWRPQTMMATNVFWRWYDCKFAVNLGRFFKSMQLVFHVFIAVAIMVYLVAFMVCGLHGIGWLLLPLHHYPPPPKPLW